MIPEAPPHRHIPLSRHELADRLLGDPTLPGGPEPDPSLAALFELLEATYHFRYHARLEAMKETYAPFNPDRELAGPPVSEAELTVAAERLAGELADVLERASYHPIPPEVIDEAFHEQALFRVNMTVDFDAFEELLVYARGRTLSQATIPRWFGLRRRTIEVESFDRVCLYVRFKAAADLTERQRRHIPYPPGSMLLKLFRNIPVADLEMLFPNCQVRMRTSDKLLVGVPALVGGVPVIIKLAPALLGFGVLLGASRRHTEHASTVAALAALVMLGGYLLQQWNRIKNRRVMFLKLLSENLYFRNLDNNEGVLTRLVDEAEEEACKEAMLAYTVALAHERPVALAELKEATAAWLRQAVGEETTFDVERSIARLVELGMAGRGDDGRMWAVPIHTALVNLDAAWDTFFLYANQARDAAAGTSGAAG